MSKKKKHKKHSRDTHFKCYASQIWQDMESAFHVEHVRFYDARARNVACDVLAKSLYDFADYCTANMKFTFAKDIPDLGEDE
ncbi:MAG TPA: hypothetical protein VEP90_13120 [Methylomirabilota bacterium]|nr:hypothetical protein [Methylomirabilota bacterium]